MIIKEFLTVLWRRKWIILITLIVIEAVVILGTLKATPIYSSSVTLRIVSATAGAISNYDYQYADRLMNTFVKLATTAPVLDELRQQLELVGLLSDEEKTIPLTELMQIEVKTLPVTELIQITVEHKDPLLAADAANALAGILISQSLELYLGSGTSSQEILGEQLPMLEEEVKQARKEYIDLIAKNPSNTADIQTAKQKLDLQQAMYATILDQYEQTRLKEAARAKSIYVAEPAIPPTEPARPRKAYNIALGFLVGLVVGLGLAFLFENLDSTFHTTDQIEMATKLPSIGMIPFMERQNSVVGLNGDFVSGEAFIRLRTNILLMENPIRTLLITSAEPKDGKSMIVSNLAYVMAQTGRKVVVVDGDLRVPTQHKIFDIDNNVGLSSILEHKATFAEVVQSTAFPGIQVLSSGPFSINPSGLLGSNQMKGLIDQLSKAFDLVIIDAPAILAVADAAVLASMVDAVALVVCREKTSIGAVRALQAQLSKVKAKSIGVIVNRAEQSTSHYYYYARKDAPLSK